MLRTYAMTKSRGDTARRVLTPSTMHMRKLFALFRAPFRTEREKDSFFFAAYIIMFYLCKPIVIINCIP